MRNSVSMLRKARGQMPATFHPRNGGEKKKNQEKSVRCCEFFLQLHDVEIEIREPRRGSLSNSKPSSAAGCLQVF